MPIDHHYNRDERLIVRLAVVMGSVVAVLTIILATTVGDHTAIVSREEVWEYSSGESADPKPRKRVTV